MAVVSGPLQVNKMTPLSLVRAAIEAKGSSSNTHEHVKKKKKKEIETSALQSRQFNMAE